MVAACVGKSKTPVSASFVPTSLATSACHSRTTGPLEPMRMIGRLCARATHCSRTLLGSIVLSRSLLPGEQHVTEAHSDQHAHADLLPGDGRQLERADAGTAAASDGA